MGVKEVSYGATPTAAQPAAGAIRTLEETGDRTRRESPARADNRRDRLDRARGAGAVDPDDQAEKRGRSTAAPSGADRGVGVSGDATDELPRDRGSDPSLRAREVPLRVDGERLDS